MTRSAQNGDTVKVHYTGTLEDGAVFDSSRNREPLEFSLGSGQLIKGFEDAVVGMAAGDTKRVNIPFADAYGARDEQLVMHFERKLFPPDITLKEGLVLTLRKPEGGEFDALVSELSDETVTLDANHPLAGEDLSFEIELVEIV